MITKQARQLKINVFMLLFGNLQGQGFQIWQTQPKSPIIFATFFQILQEFVTKYFFQKQNVLDFGKMSPKQIIILGQWLHFKNIYSMYDPFFKKKCV